MQTLVMLTIDEDMIEALAHVTGQQPMVLDEWATRFLYLLAYKHGGQPITAEVKDLILRRVLTECRLPIHAELQNLILTRALTECAIQDSGIFEGVEDLDTFLASGQTQAGQHEASQETGVFDRP